MRFLDCEVYINLPDGAGVGLAKASWTILGTAGTPTIASSTPTTLGNDISKYLRLEPTTGNSMELRLYAHPTISKANIEGFVKSIGTGDLTWK